MSDPRPFPDSDQIEKPQQQPETTRASASDEVPVPPVMSPAEVDERAQVVEALDDEDITP